MISFLSFLFLHQRTALHVAAERGRLEIVYYLVDKGANTCGQDNNGVRGVTTLKWALVIQVWISVVLKRL